MSFFIQDYGVSLILFHSPYLVDIEEEQIGRVLKLDSLKNGDVWKNIDILIFNSWLWWYRNGIKQPYELLNNFMLNHNRIKYYRQFCFKKFSVFSTGMR